MKKHRKPLNKIKIPWPTKKAMQQVYQHGLWGRNHRDFYSGEGSHDIKIVQPYLEAVEGFLSSFKEPLVICDLGCGDFNVGRQLVPLSQKYIAVDIVPELIYFNTAHFSNEKVEFRCLDIAKDKLPGAHCVIIRQVLQHLSNAEIMNILPKLSQYKYLILTEHLPVGSFEPNNDIISGQGIRLKKKSGVDLLAAPFYLKIRSKEELVSIELASGKGVIKTVLYRMF